LHGVIDNGTPIIYSEEQATISAQFAKNTFGPSFEWHTLGGMPGSGKTTLGTEILVRSLEANTEIEHYYISNQRQLVDTARKKFKESEKRKGS
jgi:hypothetical protein